MWPPCCPLTVFSPRLQPQPRPGPRPHRSSLVLTFFHIRFPKADLHPCHFHFLSCTLCTSLCWTHPSRTCWIIIVSENFHVPPPPQSHVFSRDGQTRGTGLLLSKIFPSKVRCFLSRRALSYLLGRLTRTGRPWRPLLSPPRTGWLALWMCWMTFKCRPSHTAMQTFLPFVPYAFGLNCPWRAPCSPYWGLVS